MMNLGPEYPELLADLALQLRELLIEKAHLPNDQAELIAREAAEHVRKDWGGQIIYVPTGLGHDVQQRWLEIWNKFKGDNVSELASEFGCSEIHIYRIIKRMREIERRKTQGQLFPQAPVASPK
jgi:Mor family transcriptional regulator